MPQQNEWRRTAVPLAAAALMLTSLGGYVGAYFAIVVRTEVWDQASDGGYVLRINMHYRYGGEKARVSFRPIHALDCLIRPDCWGVADVGTPRTSLG